MRQLHSPHHHVVFYLVLEVFPKPTSAAYGIKDGAYAACWAVAADARSAERRARALLEELGWDIECVDECRRVERREFLEQPESLAHFDQAAMDGIVITLHTWPLGRGGPGACASV